LSAVVLAALVVLAVLSFSLVSAHPLSNRAAAISNTLRYFVLLRKFFIVMLV